MKKIIWIITVALVVAGCAKDYEFNTQFSAPTTLNSPAAVVINVASTENIQLSWSGGGAAEGYTTYEVLFDKVGGDFSTLFIFFQRFGCGYNLYPYTCSTQYNCT
jgi:hypothetical protein